MSNFQAAVDYLTSQARCVSSDIEVRPFSRSERTGLLTLLYCEKPILAILVVLEDNLKLRLDAVGNATWRAPLEEVRRRGDTFDAVAVFYGAAGSLGAVWEESRGNRFKDDYRRIARAEDAAETQN